MFLPHATLLIYLRMKGIFQEAVQTFLQHPNRMCNQASLMGWQNFQSGWKAEFPLLQLARKPQCWVYSFHLRICLLCVCVCVRCVCGGVNSRQYRVEGHEVSKTYQSFNGIGSPWLLRYPSYKFNNQLTLERGKGSVQGIERDGHQVLRKEQETNKENWGLQRQTWLS